MRALAALVVVVTGCNDRCFIDGLNCDDTVPDAFGLSAGRAHSCATTPRGVICWGDVDPPLGIPDYIRSAGDVVCGYSRGSESIRCSGPEPVGALFGPGGGRYLGMAISETHGCAVTTAFNGFGELECWGDAPAPYSFVFDGVVAGSGHTCGTSNGLVRCWGRDELGQSSAPGGGALRGLVAADGYTCALTPEGFATCWGQPPGMLPTTWNYLELAAANEFLCALRDDRTIVCRGDEQFGRTTPPAGTFTTITVGERHGCAIDERREIICWGADEAGQASPPTRT
jgi:hypothetical protein